MAAATVVWPASAQPRTGIVVAQRLSIAARPRVTESGRVAARCRHAHNRWPATSTEPVTNQPALDLRRTQERATAIPEQVSRPGGQRCLLSDPERKPTISGVIPLKSSYGDPIKSSCSDPRPPR
jgi:hypothetical protein